MRRLRDWVPAPLAIGAALAAALAFAVHAWQALPGTYLNHVGGIWLALGYDLAHGVFYRDLWGPLGYGGTRYFPLFFTLVAGFLRAGAGPLAAGWLASAVAAALLASGLARVVRALGAPTHVVWLAAAGALAPYFVQQTLFEVRADVLAAALNLWGLAAIIPAFREPARRQPPVGAAAWWFTLAFAAKVTSLTVPGCVGLALLLGGRFRAAARFAGAMAIGGALFLGVTDLASGGRAVASWRACMMMDAGGRTLRGWLSGEFIALVSYSHLLVALLVLSIVALAAAVGLQWRAPAGHRWGGSRPDVGGPGLWLPVVLFGGVTASTALTLSSPGTISTNQLVEWIGVTFVVVAWAAAARTELRGACSAALAVVVLWMAAQDTMRAAQLWQARSDRTSEAVRQHVADLVAHAPSPVLSESPLWPTLADRHAVMLDPFALRVVMMTRPDIAQDLASKVESQYFSRVIFQVDPTSRRGRASYEHAHFGWPITARILSRYRFDSQPAADVWIYVPKGRDDR